MPTDTIPDYPIIPELDETRRVRVLEIYERGQALGNHRDLFAKVGDSLTDVEHFLHDVGLGRADLGGYPELQAVIDRYRATPILINGVEAGNSFTRWSVAAMAGAISRDILNPQAADPTQCLPDESPLACEIRLLRPALALIMIGTNDVERGDPDSFRESVQGMVDLLVAEGVVPVLSTIPDRLRPDHPEDARVPVFNQIIVELAEANALPLWNFWLALQDLSDHGLSEDRIHLSVIGSERSAVFTPEGLRYGYNLRNLTALQVLAALDAVLPE